VRDNEGQVAMGLDHSNELARVTEGRVSLVEHHGESKTSGFHKDRLDAITHPEGHIAMDRGMEFDGSERGVCDQLAQARDGQLGVKEGIRDEAPDETVGMGGNLFRDVAVMREWITRLRDRDERLEERAVDPSLLPVYVERSVHQLQ